MEANNTGADARGEAGRPDEGAALSLRAILPGLGVILALDLLAVSGLASRFDDLTNLLDIAIIIVPWATLYMLRAPSVVYGYRTRRAVAWYGWGALAGALWRGASMGLNYLLLGANAQIGLLNFSLLSALVIVPFAEETFYRGYLGRALSARFGFWIGILAQAALFTLHPTHWAQGPTALISIFAFGVLAGWLTMKTDSIWSAWGAHGFANVLPILLLWLAR